MIPDPVAAARAGGDPPRRPNIVFQLMGQRFRLDPERSRREKTGYGLTTMRERAEAVGGTFKASARPEGGTRLTVRVPLQG